MSEEDRLIEIKVPETLKDALKLAKSLVYWMQYIETNPLKIDDPMASFGGHIQEHLLYFDYWFQTEKVKTLNRNK